ncbi:MAG TPA: sensor histidine kinase [Nocardioidaceae bacterium]|nr:sensor histidine kinase [Nocardioidaceae bacterium]
MVCAGAAASLTLGGVVESSWTRQLATTADILAAALFVGAGVLRLSRWRLVRDARSGLTGAALLAVGGLTIPLAGLARALTSPESLMPAMARLLTVGIVLWILVRALSERELTQGTRSLVLLLGQGVLFCALAVLAIVAGARWASTAVALPGWTPALIEWCLGAAWLAVGLLAWRRGLQTPWAGRLAPLLCAMGAVEMLRGIDMYVAGPWGLAGATLTACIAGLASRVALLDLQEAASVEHERLQAYEGALAASETRTAGEKAWREELVHDARNALAGLRAALVTLERYDGRLDDATVERLRAAAMGEVGHLEHMLEPPGQQQVSRDFSVGAVIDTVVGARRAAGLDVDVHPTDCRAHGRPGDLATALQNLLVNAQQHAPGSTVTVRAVSRPDRIEVYVADRGPGLTREQSETLFERGARGRDSHGSGLGLHVSRKLMRAQDGDIELQARNHGAVFVLSLPTAVGAETTTVMPDQRRRLHTMPALEGAAR